MRILISTFYSLEPVVSSIHRYSPEKVYLLTDKDMDQQATNNFETLKNTFSHVIDLKRIPVNQYDIYEVAKKTVDIIDREYHNQNEIFINITGGRKTSMLGVLYGAYTRCDLVSSIHYIREEDSQPMELPKMSYDLNDVEHTLLELINTSKEFNVSEAANRLGKTKGLIYLYLKKLKSRGFIDDDFKITTAGKIALL